MLEAESFFPNNFNSAKSNGKQKKTVLDIKIVDLHQKKSGNGRDGFR